MERKRGKSSPPNESRWNEKGTTLLVVHAVLGGLLERWSGRTALKLLASKDEGSTVEMQAYDGGQGRLRFEGAGQGLHEDLRQMENGGTVVLKPKVKGQR